MFYIEYVRKTETLRIRNIPTEIRNYRLYTKYFNNPWFHFPLLQEFRLLCPEPLMRMNAYPDVNVYFPGNVITFLRELPYFDVVSFPILNTACY